MSNGVRCQWIGGTYRSLSRREAGVLQMIARGMSTKCIARSLGIVPETVKTHVKGILTKLEAHAGSSSGSCCRGDRLALIPFNSFCYSPFLVTVARAG